MQLQNVQFQNVLTTKYLKTLLFKEKPNLCYGQRKAFISMDVLKLDVLNPDVLKPDVLKPDVLKPDILKPDVLRE